MRRRLFHFATCASLVLCGCAFSAAVRGPSGSGYTLFQPLSPPRPYTGAELAAYKSRPPSFDFAGFRVQRSYRLDNAWTDGRIFVIPWWFVAVMSAIAPAAWLRGHLRRHRQRKRVGRGLCPACGYDLRGTPERCPECGAHFPRGIAARTE
jgi:hypothetical protein